jgi:hypothetical protein
VENKRLGQALSVIKAQQDLKHVPKVMTNSENIAYKKRPKSVYGAPETSTDTAPERADTGTLG